MKNTLLALAVLAGTAHADAKNEVAIGSFDRAMHASSANAVTADSLGGGVIGYARKLELGLTPRLQTWATGGLAIGGAEGTMFSTLTTELDTLSVSAGGRARYTVWRNLRVGGRLDLGMARAALTIREGDRELYDQGWGMTATAAAALDLLAIASARFQLGVRLELGYTLTSAIELAPAEANDAATIQLEMSQASLGSLDLGGKFFSLTVLSQF
ncbi:MAG: hypothetical protein JNL83_39630 [Myxococcales bacterium]|nr:hypothetical protein [Myxococcales bacterium]